MGPPPAPPLLLLPPQAPTRSGPPAAAGPRCRQRRCPPASLATPAGLGGAEAALVRAARHHPPPRLLPPLPVLHYLLPQMPVLHHLWLALAQSQRATTEAQSQRAIAEAQPHCCSAAAALPSLLLLQPQVPVPQAPLAQSPQGRLQGWSQRQAPLPDQRSPRLAAAAPAAAALGCPVMPFPKASALSAPHTRTQLAPVPTQAGSTTKVWK